MKRGIALKFTNRQEEIIKIVKAGGPITSEAIAEKLGVTRAALRADLAILTMTGTLDARPKVGYVYLGKKVDDFSDAEADNYIELNGIKSELVIVEAEV